MVVPQGSRGEFLTKNQRAATADAISYGLSAERAGYSGLWIYDHVLPAPAIEPCVVLECWTLVAAMASRTEKVTVGSLVSCALFRSPVLLAKMADTVQAIAKGRLILGLGAGWYTEEFAALDLTPAPLSVRYAKLEETLALVSIQPGGRDSKRRRRFNSDPAGRYPVWVGGGGEMRTLPLTVRYGDAWNLSSPTLEEFTHKNRIVDGLCRDMGRRSDTIRRTIQMDCLVVANSREVRSATERLAQSTQRSPEDVRARDLVGTPEMIVDRLRGYRKAGAGYAAIWFADSPSPDSMYAFSRSVAPRLD